MTSRHPDPQTSKQLRELRGLARASIVLGVVLVAAHLLLYRLEAPEAVGRAFTALFAQTVTGVAVWLALVACGVVAILRGSARPAYVSALIALIGCLANVLVAVLLMAFTLADGSKGTSMHAFQTFMIIPALYFAIVWTFWARRGSD